MFRIFGLEKNTQMKHITIIIVEYFMLKLNIKYIYLETRSNVKTTIVLSEYGAEQLLTV